MLNELSQYGLGCVVTCIISLKHNSLYLSMDFLWWSRMQCSNKGNGDGAEKDHHNAVRDTDCLETGSNCSTDDLHGVQSIKCPTFQRGVLRTNCIDCLDRTNVAQYAYGLVGLGHQLHALGFIDVENIALGSLLADSLMKIYEEMGDTLALQYGGSAAHNKVMYMIWK